MLHFLQTVKKDLGKAVNAGAKAGKKTLNFVENTGQDVADTASAVVHHPAQVGSAFVKALAQPVEGLGQDINSGIIQPSVQQAKKIGSPKNIIPDILHGVPADNQVKQTYQNNVKSGKISPLAAKTASGNNASTEDLHALNQIVAQGGGDTAVAKYFKDKEAQTEKSVKKVVGETANVASNFVGAGVAKDVVTGARATKDISTLDKLKGALVNTGKVAKEAGAATGVSSAGSQLSETGKINPAETLSDALKGGLLGGGGTAAGTVVKNAPKIVKALDETATNVAARHPSVIALDQHLQSLSEHRDQLLKNGASHVAIKANDMAYKSALQARDNTIKAIKEGGFVGNNDNPGGGKAFMEALAPSTTQNLDDMEAAGAATKLKEQKTIPTGKPGYEVPKSGATLANESLPNGARLDPSVVDLLDKTGKAQGTASKAPVLEGGRDPQSVMARYMGKEGSDIVYEATQAAKKRSDLQNAANPLIDDAEKKLKATAKTDAGRQDVEHRINQALEDRANSDNYLHTPEEKAAYEATKKFYDHYQGHIEKAGKGTLENYSPRVARQNAADASEGLDYTVNQAFSKNATAPYLKERTKDVPDQQLLEKPISTMRGYSSSVSKQLAYEDMLGKLPERLQKVNPVYTLNQTDKQSGKNYLQKYLKDLLQPDIPTSGKGLGKVISEKGQNKLIGNTYSSALSLSPRFGILNRTQGYATRSQVSREARVLSRKMDKKDLVELRKNLTSGDNPISGEITESASNIGGSKTKFQKVQAKVSGEQGNVNHAFDAGVAQHLVESPIYKAAIKAGKKPKEAAKEALADPDTKDLAIRAGNTVTNTTQFGGNIANKPGWLRESGTILGFSKKWYQQYQRFPLGMLQLLGNVTNPKNARALDIMRRGDPKQTQLVDYLKAAQTLQNALPDAKKVVKAGETGVTKEQLAHSKDLLDKSVKILNAEIKKNSSIRGGKTARNVAKMWAAATTIQFLFDGATNNGQDKTTGQQLTKAAEFGAPVNIPTKNSNPIFGAQAPSLPKPGDAKKQVERKLLNFIPVVGPVVNRGRELKGLIEALTGGSN